MLRNCQKKMLLVGTLLSGAVSGSCIAEERDARAAVFDVQAFQILDDTPYIMSQSDHLSDTSSAAITDNLGPVSLFTVTPNLTGPADAEPNTDDRPIFEILDQTPFSPHVDVKTVPATDEKLSDQPAEKLAEPLRIAADHPAPETTTEAAPEVASAQAKLHDYFVVSQPVRDFVAVLSGDTGRRINISENIRSRISNSRITGTVDEIIAWLEARHDVDCFEFNGTYYLSARSEAKTRVVRLGDMMAEDARKSLSDAGLDEQDYAFRVTAGGSAVALSGPPRLLAVAETIIETFPAAEDGPPGPRIRVRRGIEISLESVTEEKT